MTVLHAQYKVIATFEDLVEKSKAMPKEVAEPLFVNPLKEISKSLSKVLRESNIITDEAKQEH
jgi:hypothetical protein